MPFAYMLSKGAHLSYVLKISGQHEPKEFDLKILNSGKRRINFQLSEKALESNDINDESHVRRERVQKKKAANYYLLCFQFHKTEYESMRDDSYNRITLRQWRRKQILYREMLEYENLPCNIRCKVGQIVYNGSRQSAE